MVERVRIEHHWRRMVERHLIHTWKWLTEAVMDWIKMILVVGISDHRLGLGKLDPSDRDNFLLQINKFLFQFLSLFLLESISSNFQGIKVVIKIRTAIVAFKFLLLYHNLFCFYFNLYFYIHSICFQPTVIHFHRKFIHIQRDRVLFLFKLNDDMMQCNEDINIIYLL